jgi:hypothetical protein
MKEFKYYNEFMNIQNLFISIKYMRASHDFLSKIIINNNIFFKF